MSNPLYRYLNGKNKTKKRSSGNMARKRRGRSRGRSFGGGNMINDALAGAGIAAMAKRFIGAPLGAYTGVAGAGAYAMFSHKNVLGYALGAGVHDFIGNVGGNNTGGVQIYS